MLPCSIMTTPAATRALALDIRQADTNALLGIALIVPSQRYIAVIEHVAGKHREPSLQADAWLAIDAWAAAGDAGLPTRPAPLDDAVASALLRQNAPVIARRFASIPLDATSPADVAAIAARALPGFLLSRRTAA